MRFPLSWLRDWIDLPESLDQISDMLIKVGVGLEAVENPAAHLGQVVVARILKREPHPAADKLSLCQVSDGGATPLQIVCGAQNYKEGDLVPLAREGAVLPGDFKIKRSKIRGVESFGMLCSTQELGLGKGEDGLLILPQDLKEGMPLAEALGLDDPILTVETTANRPDHLSIRGLAREIGALTGRALKPRSVEVKESGPGIETQMKAATLDEAACPRYTVRILRGLKVGPAPEALKRRLEAAGLRSINNVVDATNYVLLEYGQPMHAFDLSKLEGGRVEARPAAEGEALVTLDHQARSLKADDLVIADGRKALALGGVMGGEASEVGPSTSEVLLEAAIFRPATVRRSSRRLGLRSESSLRFERGVDPGALDEAMDRCVQLIQESAGGLAAPGRLSAGRGPAAPEPVRGKSARINALLGSDFSAGAMAAMLARRGFKAQAEGDALAVTPPSWRPDVAIEADLAEEVAHLAGLDSFAATGLPEVRTPDADDAEWQNIWRLKDSLKGLGLKEADALSYLDPALAEAWGLATAAPSLDNPWSAELSLLRPSLLPNLVQSALESLKRQAAGAAFFELGRVFSSKDGAISERSALAVALLGMDGEGNWACKGREYDFYDLRGLAEGLAAQLGFSLKLSAEAQPPAWLHPGQAARVQLGPLKGLMGALHPSLAKSLDCRVPAMLLELEGFSREALDKPPRFSAFSSLPFVERDLSCLVDQGFEAGTLLEALRKEGGFSASQIRLKDAYQGAPLPQGKKSLTVAVTYLAGEKTLTDAEVNERHAGLLAALKSRLPVEIRE